MRKLKRMIQVEMVTSVEMKHSRRSYRTYAYCHDYDVVGHVSFRSDTISKNCLEFVSLCVDTDFMTGVSSESRQRPGPP